MLDLLEPNPGYIHENLRAKSRKEMKRQWNRLSETGETRCDVLTSPAELAAGAQQFLAIEASGWKGRRGTAMAQKVMLEQMFRKVVAGLGAHGACAIERLMVAGRPVAISVSLGKGERRWLWKTAYDEAYARFSPGSQLVYRMTADLAESGERVLYDSCAQPDHPMIDHVWKDRRRVCGALLASGRTGGFGWSVILTAESLRRSGLVLARQLRSVLGRR